ncbi:MAG: hypothetical protein ABIN79_09675 [Marmoricola sp.]
MSTPTLDDHLWAELKAAGQVPAPPEQVLLHTRAALRRAATTETLRRDVVRLRGRRRLLARTAIGVAAAAAVVATVGIVDLGGTPTPSAAAASVLTRAAAELEALPPPGPGQYLTVRTVTVRKDAAGSAAAANEVTETWLPTMDTPGMERVTPSPGAAEDALLLPLSRSSESGGELGILYATHPSDPARLLSALRRLARAEGDGASDGTANVWQTAFGVVSDNSAPLDLKSDVLRAVARLDGVAIVARSVEVGDRRGEAVGLVDSPHATWLVFDKTSHDYLGVVGHPETGGTWTMTTTYGVADGAPWTRRLERQGQLYDAPVPSS